MEIGSFIELQFPCGLEYHTEDKYGKDNIARLNSGRAAIWHAFRLTECSAIWLPYYQCETVRDFLYKKGCTVKFYHIDKNFYPTDIEQSGNEAVLIVNYFGIMSKERLENTAKKFKNVIVDNSQGFFAQPIEDCFNVYSCRKFVGVPDGAYVIGNGAKKHTDEYPQGYSSDTSQFLLQRIEYGCEGKTYRSREINENRIDNEDIMKMSLLTHRILNGTDYGFISDKRRENFKIGNKLFANINKINPLMSYDETCVPMVYPLVVEDDTLLKKMLDNKHFQGHWWNYLLTEMPKDSVEYYISRYVIPITIDQRYSEEDLFFIRNIID